MLSLYIAIDRGAILAFLFRLVPPNYLGEARLLQKAVGRSFGGFLRGQVVMGVTYGLIAADRQHDHWACRMARRPPSPRACST